MLSRKCKEVHNIIYIKLISKNAFLTSFFFVSFEFSTRSHIQFTMDSAAMMQQGSHIEVVSTDLYTGNPGREPAPYGVLDRRMVCYSFL